MQNNSVVGGLGCMWQSCVEYYPIAGLFCFHEFHLSVVVCNIISQESVMWHVSNSHSSLDKINVTAQESLVLPPFVNPPMVGYTAIQTVHWKTEMKLSIDKVKVLDPDMLFHPVGEFTLSCSCGTYLPSFPGLLYSSFLIACSMENVGWRPGREHIMWSAARLTSWIVYAIAYSHSYPQLHT